MAAIDWTIFATLLALLVIVAWWAKRYLRSVADFIVVDRKMRKYLGLSAGTAEGLGLIGIANFSEQGFKYGLGYVWMSLLNMAVLVPVFGIVGFGIRRFRATGVQTIPQFHEMRYSRGVRICVGVALATGGILNMAIFPIVSSEFLVQFLNLPATVSLAGLDVKSTYLCMALLISIALTMALSGGMVTVIVTDYLQSIIIATSVILITILIFAKFSISDMDRALTSNYGESAYSPFSRISYGWDWVLFFILSGVLGQLSFPPSTSKMSAADTTDTTRKMALLSGLFGSGRTLMILLWGVGTLVAVGSAAGESARDPNFARNAAAGFVRDLAPMGVVGLCASAMVFAYVCTDSSYYLSWAAIVVNDVIAPLRGKPLTQQQHLKHLRLVMVGIAAFLLAWGIWYRPPETILSYLYLTGAIFTAAGIITFFGLYWKRANALGAYCTVAICMIVPLADLIGKQIYQDDYKLKGHQSGLIALLAGMGAIFLCGMLGKSGFAKWVDYGQAVRDEDDARRRARLAKEAGP